MLGEYDPERLRNVLRLVLEQGRLADHSHWDNTLQYGAGCPLCIKQREVYEAVRITLEGK